jgi:outer membrane biosynthesis protein TonB
VPKATDSAKTVEHPLQPSPKTDDQQQEQPEKKQVAQQKTAIGDLAMAKPNEGKTYTNTDAVEPKPEHHRPRLLKDVPGHSGMAGQQMRQSGGVQNLALDPSFAAIAKSYGNYDAQLIDAVRTCWFNLLQDRTPTVTGKVVVSFTLLPSGRVMDVKIASNTVDDFYGTLCSSAILNSAPFGVWPRQMQLDLGSDHRDVQFTFFYDNE